VGFLDDSLEDDFRRFEEEIKTDPVAVLLARWRRDEITKALMTCPDVEEVIPSGSLARGTHVGPIHDIDLVVVFKADKHPPDWGRIGTSAEEALTHLRAEIEEKMLAGRGSQSRLVHSAGLRNHVVKCELDPSLGPLDAVIPGAPPVDIMPAIRQGDHLRVPERENRRWIDVDPERLINMVAARQRQWSNFKQVVRMVKVWADHHDIRMNNLAVEVLVLEYCPRPGLFESLSCSDAVASFFERAASKKIWRLEDPAGHCGEIDPHMDYAALRRALDESKKLAQRAVSAEHAWKDPHQTVDGHPRPEDLWREIFGPKFARPSFWSWLIGRPARRYPDRAHSWLDAEAIPLPVPGRQHERFEPVPSGPARHRGAPETRGPEGATARGGWRSPYERRTARAARSEREGENPEPGPAPRGPAPRGPAPRGPGPAPTPAGHAADSGRTRRSLAGVLGSGPAAVPSGPVIFG
jgi:predicted nucleotidyltransferase